MTIPKKANSWEEAVLVIDNRPAEMNIVSHGISRSRCGNEVYVDFGDEIGIISKITIHFRDYKDASAIYCKGIKLDLKVVEHPEHEVK